MRGRLMLVATMLVAVLLTAATTTALLLADPAVPGSEAVRTGALSGGAVIALYALWLNDRRRRTEEARHELESDKVADERFARSVELLGSEADQVRVGALHALARLAEATPRYKQTVLDVLCAYLRRPFCHAGYAEDGAPVPAAPPVEPAADGEREVRLTVQRLITDLLPWGQNPDVRAYHLDLTGATLEQFRLEGRRIGRLAARRARFHGSTQLAQLQASKPVLFGGATFLGPVSLRDARLDGGVSFHEATFDGEVTLEGATVHTFLTPPTTEPTLRIGALDAGPGTRVDAGADGWALTGPTP